MIIIAAVSQGASTVGVTIGSVFALIFIVTITTFIGIVILRYDHAILSLVIVFSRNNFIG